MNRLIKPYQFQAHGSIRHLCTGLGARPPKSGFLCPHSPLPPPAPTTLPLRPPPHWGEGEGSPSQRKPPRGHRRQHGGAQQRYWPRLQRCLLTRHGEGRREGAGTHSGSGTFQAGFRLPRALFSVGAGGLEGGARHPTVNLPASRLPGAGSAARVCASLYLDPPVRRVRFPAPVACGPSRLKGSPPGWEGLAARQSLKPSL